MHEFKHGELEQAQGGKVKKRRQAVAIALREAGASRSEAPKKNEQNLRRTKRKERRGETAQARTEGRAKSRGNAARTASSGMTKAELYREARRRDIPGRSTMSKADLARALHR